MSASDEFDFIKAEKSARELLRVFPSSALFFMAVRSPVTAAVASRPFLSASPRKFAASPAVMPNSLKEAAFLATCSAKVSTLIPVFWPTTFRSSRKLEA